jgi:hypothetical protein
MDRHITITGEFTEAIPVDAGTPGKFTGTSRGDFMKMVFSLAAQYGWEIRVGGQRW